jgi:hypothetical protein
MKPYEGHKNYGHYRRDKHRGQGYYDRPHRGDRHFRHHKHRRYGHNPRHHRHDYYGRRHHRHGHRHGHRHDYGHRYSTYFGLYLYPRIAYPGIVAPPAYPGTVTTPAYPGAVATPAYPGTVAPQAYPVRPQASYVQPAVVEEPRRGAEAPSTCLMTREYQTEIVVGDELVPAYGKACLQPDGSWYRGPAVPETY